MPSRVRVLGGAVALAIAALSVSTGAVQNWASEEALGDVAVSFDGQVLVLDDTNPNAATPVDTLSVPGTNGGLAFDTPLNLLVTNTSNNQLLKLLSLAPHSSSTIATQPLPSALAIAADGTIYVASAGSPATIRRIPASGTCPTSGCDEFTIPTDSTACIGIDLAADQSTLYYVSGGRAVRSVADVRTLTGPAAGSTSTFTTLPNPGTACGMRLLPPVDARCATTAVAECLETPVTFPTPTVGGMIIADGREIKRLNSSGAVVETFNTTSGNDSQKRWIDVALDPNTRDFYGVEAQYWQLAKFRLGEGPDPLVSLALPSVPRGVAINGELRAAQTIQLEHVTASTRAEATFLQGLIDGQGFSAEHKWIGKWFEGAASTQFAVQAIEVRYDPNGIVTPICDPSLDIRCRLQNFDSATQNPIPKDYSRGRRVFYREILREPVAEAAVLEVGIMYPGPAEVDGASDAAGTACVPGVTPRNGTALLRDPFPHDLFELDGTLVFYGGDDGGITRTRINDTVVVDRGDVKYSALLVKPTDESVAQLDSILTVALEVRDPHAACSFVSGLNEMLVLSVTDITPGPDKGKVIGDSENILGMLSANGLTWASTASQYRTNLLVSSTSFTADHKYRLCVAAPRGQATSGDVPLVGEVCSDFIAKLGKSRK